MITGYSGMDKEAALYVLSYVAKNFVSIMFDELKAIECWKDDDTSKIINCNSVFFSNLLFTRATILEKGSEGCPGDVRYL